jgi:hypothetical protein
MGAVTGGHVSAAKTKGGGVVSAYPYPGYAVSVAPRAYLSQASSSVSDPTSYTLSVWHERIGVTQSEFFDFGDFTTLGPTYHIITSNSKIELFIVGQGGATTSVVSPVCYVEGAKNHIFIAFQCSGGGVIWVNGVSVCSFANAGSLTSINVNGFPITIPPSYHNETQEYADLQCWFGQYIDPAGTFSGAPTLKAGQTVQIQQVYKAFVAANVDPVYGLAVFDMETNYGNSGAMTGSTGPAGFFQLNKSEVQTEAGVTGGKYYSSDNQTKAFNIHSNGSGPLVGVAPGHGNWATDAILNFDEPGTNNVNLYKVFNQGQVGSNAIWNAADTSVAISTLSSGLQTNMLGQAWAVGDSSGTNRFGLHVQLTNSNTIQDWIDNFNTAWGQMIDSANSKLTAATTKNINAFIGTDLHPVDPAVALAQFGAPDLKFVGKAATFVTNAGTGGTFTFAGAALTDVGTITTAGKP